MSIRIILLLLFGFFFRFPLIGQSTEWKNGIVLDEFIYTQAPYPSCHASTIAETPDGVVAAWFGGTREGHPDVGIWVSHRKEGKWSPSVEVANGIQNDTLRYPAGNPVLFMAPNGELWLFYKVCPLPDVSKGMMMKSIDNGYTWSKPQPWPEGFFGAVKNKPILLPDGKIISPSSTEDENGWRVHLESTSDFGKSWEKTGHLNDGKSIKVIQPTVLRYPDGTLQILCRSRNRAIIGSRSCDNGKTWSEMAPVGLPNNNSGIDGVTLADGRQLLVYNHVLPPKGEAKGTRTPLNVSVTKNGKTWYAALVLEDSKIGQYSYPSVIQTSDGLVHVVYTWRRERIKHVVIDPAQLRLRKIKHGEWPH